MASIFRQAGLKSGLSDGAGQRGRNKAGRSGANAVAARSDGDDARAGDSARKEVNRLVEQLVIPRLIATSIDPERSLAGTLFGPSAKRTSHRFSEQEIVEFTRLCISEKTTRLLRIIDRQLAAGHSVESIYIEMLAPAARLLGVYWETDEADFVAVTMGLWRIQEILRELTVRVPPPRAKGSGLRSALLSPMPGDQHSLGTLMLADLFERNGWQTDVLLEPSVAELTAKCASQAYDIVALTITCDCSSARLGQLITSLRTVAVNRHLKIMVGGQAINSQPHLAVECGADATAVDASSAVAVADRLVPVVGVGLDYLA